MPYNILMLPHVKCYRSNYGIIVSRTQNHFYGDHDRMRKKDDRTEADKLRCEYESKRRAFQRGSNIIYLHQDKLTTFVTLTYKNQTDDYKKVVNDIQEVFGRRKISYIAVVEKHKTGMFHVHAITSDLPNVVSLRKGKYSWKSWRRGFSDVKFIGDTDDKFRIEKYIFKYLKKSEKIGGRYFLKSNDLTLREEDPRYAIRNLPFQCQRGECLLDTAEDKIYEFDGFKIPVRKEFYIYVRQIQTQFSQGCRPLRN